MPLGGKMIAFVGVLISSSYSLSSLVLNVIKVLYEEDRRNLKYGLIFFGSLSTVKVRKNFNIE